MNFNKDFIWGCATSSYQIEGAASEDDFTVAKNIKGVKLRARATGSLSNTNLNLAATIKKASALLGNGSNTSTGE